MRFLVSCLSTLLLLAAVLYPQSDPAEVNKKFVKPAHALANAGKYEEAIDLLTQAIQLNPKLSHLYLTRAHIYWNMGRTELIKADVDAGIYHDADKYNMSIRGGVLLANARRCAEAMEILTAATVIDPTRPDAFGARASAHLCSGDKIGAINDIDVAISLGDTSVTRLSFRRDLINQIGNNRPEPESDVDLIQAAEAALRNSPGEGRLKFELVYLYNKRLKKFEKTERLDEMFSDLDRVIEIIGDARSYSQRGLAYYRYKKYKLAVEDFSKAIELQPELPFYYSYRANAYVALKMYAEAIADFEKGLTFKSKIDKYLAEGLSKAREKLKNTGEDQ